jgi:putative transposase
MTSPPHLTPGVFYHIYDRGVNRENIFIEERNYHYFLNLYIKHIEPVADTFVYCLLKNHFHLLLRTKEQKNEIDATAGSRMVSVAFSNFLNAYAKAVNKTYGRTGSLLQHPFGRIAVQSQAHLLQLVRYIHFNPQKHGLISDFREWPYSSYRAYVSAHPTRLQRDEVLAWFNGLNGFLAMHQTPGDEAIIAQLAPDDM